MAFFQKWRFFDRATHSFAQMALIWGQNSNILLQMVVLTKLQLQMMPEASDKGQLSKKMPLGS